MNRDLTDFHSTIYELLLIELIRFFLLWSVSFLKVNFGSYYFEKLKRNIYMWDNIPLQIKYLQRLNYYCTKVWSCVDIGMALDTQQIFMYIKTTHVTFLLHHVFAFNESDTVVWRIEMLTHRWPSQLRKGSVLNRLVIRGQHFIYKWRQSNNGTAYSEMICSIGEWETLNAACFKMTVTGMRNTNGTLFWNDFDGNVRCIEQH